MEIFNEIVTVGQNLEILSWRSIKTKYDLIYRLDKKWRDMRNILTPVFTGSKLRGLVQLISNCGEKTVNHLVEKLKEQNTKLLKIDIMDTTTRFTNDVIATSAFGIEVNSIKDPKNDFFMAGREIIRFPMWRFFMLFFFPALSKVRHQK